jgi:WD40 repeat protein
MLRVNSPQFWRSVLILLIPAALAWKLWDVVSWRPKVLGSIKQAPLGRKDNEAQAVAFSPDGKLLAVARRRWIYKSFPLKGKSTIVNGIGKVVVEVWDTKRSILVDTYYSPDPLLPPSFTNKGIRTADYLCFSPDSRRLLIAGPEELALLDINAKRYLHFIKLQRFSSNSRKRYEVNHNIPVGFSSKGDCAFYLNRQFQEKPRNQGGLHEPYLRLIHRAQLVVCDTTTGKVVRRTPLSLQQGEWPTNAAILADNRTLVCTTSVWTESGRVGDFAKVIAFDILDGKRLRTLVPRRSEFKTLSASPVALDFAVGMHAGSHIEVWKEFRPKIHLTAASIYGPKFLKYDQTGTKLIGGNNSGNLVLWEVHSGKIIWQRHEEKFLKDAAISPDGATIALASSDGNARLWRVR